MTDAPRTPRKGIEALASATARYLSEAEADRQRKLDARDKKAPSEEARTALKLVLELPSKERAWLIAQLK